MSKQTDEEIKKALAKDYQLIPMKDITDEARIIAKTWYAGVSDIQDIRECHKLASDIINYARRYAASLSEVNNKALIKKVWAMAMTYGNNLCVSISDDFNNDDEIEKADAANRCAKLFLGEINDPHPDVLKLSPAILPVKEDEWISLKKKLPPKFKNVLCISKKGQIRIACVDSSGKIDEFELEVDRNDKYTHWQPLPLPPAKK